MQMYNETGKHHIPDYNESGYTEHLVTTDTFITINDDKMLKRYFKNPYYSF